MNERENLQSLVDAGEGWIISGDGVMRFVPGNLRDIGGKQIDDEMVLSMAGSWGFSDGIELDIYSITVESQQRSKLPDVNYRGYIQSAEWKRVATAAKERARWCCQLCNEPGNKTTLHAHHRTYDRLGFEAPEDITVLCAGCHAKFHGVIDG